MSEEKKKKSTAKASAKKAEKKESAEPSAKKASKKKIKKEGKGSKRYRAASEGLDKTKLVKIEDAISEIKKRATAKFDETIDIAINLGIDAKNTEQSVRGVVPMPNGLGKSIRVAVFAKGAKATDAEKAGADLVGAEELAEKVEKGQVDFDRCIATPDMMGLVGKLGKVLGPKGLMPNPKLGTVTMDVAAAVKAAKSGQAEFRADKAGIIHAGIGKASFSEKALLENIKAFVGALKQAKPAESKGNYFQSAVLTSTMGPGVKIDINSLAA